ncbi:MAG: serine/threonine-protein kinase, partial [Pirellulales bacterium]
MIVKPSNQPRDQTPRSVAERIDLICDAFEDSWRSGQRPTLSSFLQQTMPSEQRQLFRELVMLDIEYRRRQGETVRPGDYLTELPEFSDEIRALELASDEDHEATRTLDDDDACSSLIVRAPEEYLAQFRLVERLGSGGSGEVWKAWDTQLCRHVALKLLRDLQPSESQRQRFVREARAAACLRHENIVPVYEIDKHAGTVFIVEEFIEGDDLGKQCRTERLGPREAARIGAAVADAMQAAHDAGIVHRDLKPANILMDRQGKPFVADFGIAKWADDSGQMTIAGEIIGTPAYMAPEQARGDVAAVDHRTDVYAMGAVLYQLLTGQAPFQGESATMLHAVVHDEPPAPRTLHAAIPRDLETICLRAMQKEPRQRYATARHLGDDLQRFLRGEPIHARPATIVERTWRKVRRRPAVALAAASLVLLLAACGFAFSLANENRALTGVQTVKLTTEPTGAEVTFVPLSASTGEPQPEKLLHVGASPIAKQLTPGDYLVVAVLPDGRFHEVLRRVPEPGRQMPASYPHLRWQIDEQGNTVLPPIRIPEQEVSQDMAHISASPIELVWQSHPRRPRETRQVPAFLCDPEEFTVGQFRKIRSGRVPIDNRWIERPDDFALASTYDAAVAIAEASGKRLPSMEELKRLEQLPGNTPQQQAAEAIGPVGVPATDWVEATPRIYGVRSNVAEWTTSLPFWLDGDERTKGFVGFQMADYRIIKGGALANQPGRPRSAVGDSMMVSRFELSP